MKDVIPAGFFVDAVNPTDDEIMRWAFIEGAHYPPEMSQDWDLCVAEPARREPLLRLANDATCPNRKFFLSCLYLMVGDCVRSAGNTWNREEASEWLGTKRIHALADVHRFFERARDLITGRTAFVYVQWCDGGYAYGDKET